MNRITTLKEESKLNKLDKVNIDTAFASWLSIPGMDVTTLMKFSNSCTDWFLFKWKKMKMKQNFNIIDLNMKNEDKL